MSSDDNRDIAYAALAFGFGVWSFFRGFQRLRRKRKIENIPTSTVRGAAMGLVELTGKCRKEIYITAPLTNIECVYYRYSVERYERSGKSGHWVTVAKGDSCDCPFWLEDPTGKILVLSRAAEFIMPEDYHFETGFGKSMEPNLVKFLEKNHISYRSFMGTYPLRFKEWRLIDGDDIYVLGTASSIAADTAFKDHKQKLIERLEQLKSDPKRMAEIDTNKDGQISNDEWDAAVKNVEQELLEQELKSGPSNEQISVMVSKGSPQEVFIISDYSQKDLIQKLAWQAFGGIFGGAALALAMLWWIVFRVGSLWSN